MTDEDRETLTAYLDGELDEAAEQALEARLSRDDELRAEFGALKQTWGLLDYLPKAAPSADFTNRTIDRLSLESRGSQSALGRRVWPVRRIALWVAGALVAVGIGAAGSAAYRRYVETPMGPDEPIVRNLRLFERLPAYDAVDNIEFLKSLDRPDLFGDEGS